MPGVEVQGMGDKDAQGMTGWVLWSLQPYLVLIRYPNRRLLPLPKYGSFTRLVHSVVRLHSCRNSIFDLARLIGPGSHSGHSRFGPERPPGPWLDIRSA